MTIIRNVMIDTETLSLCPDAAIVDVGAVYRDASGLACMFECSVSPRQYSVQHREFHIDPKTIAWHKQNNRANLDEYFRSEETPQSMAGKLVDFLEQAKEGGQYELKIWCCGTDFDIPKLEHLLSPSRGVHKLPWKYSNVADYRTLRDLFPAAMRKVPRNENKHGALSDAVHQFLVLEEILKGLSYNTPEVNYLGD